MSRNNGEKRFSFPKEKIKVLLLEKIHPASVEVFSDAGYRAELLPNAYNEPELISAVEDVHILGVRSRTLVTEKVLQAAKRLIAVGCFTVGTDQVELEAARSHGVPVFNAPHSSTRSVAELAVGNIIGLARRVSWKSGLIHSGTWDKAVSGAVEVRNKTVGIIGFGHIGQQVGLLAEALGMNVLFYDVLKKLPLGRMMPTDSLEQLLSSSDFVTLHVPGGDETRNMISTEELQLMKNGSFLINLSRGSVVDLEALTAALKSKHLAGAAIDVFPTEPAVGTGPFSTPLAGLENVILTPHIGGSTEEAQRNIGREVAHSLISYLDVGSTEGAVNFPAVHLPLFPHSHRILNVHRNQPGALSDINRVVSDVGANIESQYLSTHRDVGYLIMDLDRQVADEVHQKIAALPKSIKTRILY